jgi:hypothetical protein
MEMKRVNPLGKDSSIGRMLRLLGVNRGYEVPSNSREEKSQPRSFNIKAYLSVDRRMQEIQAEKALLIWESRHDKWKAGGPV